MIEAFHANADYDGIAKYYDGVAGWSLVPLRRDLARRAAGAGARRVLDVGCGTGLQLIELARQGLAATGLDNSPAMLAVAGQRLAAAGPLKKTPALLLASGASLPFKPGSFDLAVMCLLLHESAEEPFALLDAVMAVTPRLFILEWNMPERNLEYPLHWGVHIIERLAGRRHFASFRQFMRRGSLEGLMQRYALHRSAQGLVPLNITERCQMCLNTMLFMRVEI